MKTLLNNGSQTAFISTEPTPHPRDGALTRVSEGRSTATAKPPLDHEAAAAPDGSARITHAQPRVPIQCVHRYGKWLLLAGILATLKVGGYFSVPWVRFWSTLDVKVSKSALVEKCSSNGPFHNRRVSETQSSSF